MRRRRELPALALAVAVAVVVTLTSCSGESAGDRDRRGDTRADTTQDPQDPQDPQDSTHRDSTRGDDDGGDPQGLTAATAPAPMPALADRTTCPTPTVTVRDATALSDALAAATPGDSIALAAGTYEGKFVASVTASVAAPIFLCGPRDAVIDGGGIKGGYAIHLDSASGWRLVGFTVRNAQKGVVADRVSDVVIEGLLVEDIGDEAIHLRTFSTDNVVRGNEIRDTGQRRAKFGEGVYVGSATSNWCTYTDCEPDRSDRNTIEGNLIYGTTSESVDLKEGTTGGVVRGNTFGGGSLSGADSWMDVKGNDWVIEGNLGIDSPQDGFQMHEILDGWGTGNVFRDNRAELGGSGVGFAVTNTSGNVIDCSNEAVGAAQGLADVACTP